MAAQKHDAATGRRVCVGRIGGAHGIQGWVRLQSYTAEPGDIGSYGPLSDESGERRLTVTVKRMAKGNVIAAIDGVSDRNAAEALAGLRLYVDRASLPEASADEFYRTDLIGLAAVLADGSTFGVVVGVEDYGAGDILEIRPPQGPSILMPFTTAAVPQVDIAAGRVVIDPPAGLLGPDGDETDVGDDGPAARGGQE